jgi:hypothetical protein
MESSCEPLVDWAELTPVVKASRSALEVLIPAGLPCYDIGKPGAKRRRLRFRVSEVLDFLRKRAA